MCDRRCGYCTAASGTLHDVHSAPATALTLHRGLLHISHDPRSATASGAAPCCSACCDIRLLLLLGLAVQLLLLRGWRGLRRQRLLLLLLLLQLRLLLLLLWRRGVLLLSMNRGVGLPLGSGMTLGLVPLGHTVPVAAGAIPARAIPTRAMAAVLRVAAGPAAGPRVAAAAATAPVAVQQRVVGRDARLPPLLAAA